MNNTTKLLTVAALLGVASLNSQTIANYGWEDGGILPDLGAGPQLFGPVGGVFNVSAENGVTPLEGFSMYKFTDTGDSGTSTTVVAFISGLNEGDTVTAQFSGNAPLTAGSGVRQWASWRNADGTFKGSASSAATAGDLNKYFGLAGWEASDLITYTVPAGETVLGIEARGYQSSGDTVPVPFYVDSLTVTAPNGAIITVAVPEPTTYAALFGLLGLGFVLARRRRKS
jgi:hypothetical protein